eukprot:gene5615-4017_t
MSKELTKEQLLEYVKKQKLKIKKLETDLSEALSKAESTGSDANPPASSAPTEVVTELEAKLSAKEEEVGELDAKLRQYEKRQSDFLRDFEAKEAIWEHEKSQLNAKVDKLVSENQLFLSLESEKNQLQSKLQSAELAKEQLVQMFQDLQRDYDEVASQRNALKAAEATWAATTAELQSTVEALKSTSDASSSELDSLVADLRVQLAALSREKEAADASLQQQLEGHRTEVAGLHERTASLQDTIATLQSEKTESEQALQREREAVEASFREQSAALTNQVASLEAAVASLKETMAALEADKAQLEESLKRQSSSSEEQSSQLADEKAAWARLMDEKDADHSARLAQHAEEWTAQIASLQSAHEAQQKQLEDDAALQRQALEEELAQLRTAAATGAAAAEPAAADEAAADLALQLEEAKKTAEQLLGELASKGEELLRLSTELAQAEARQAGLQQQLQEAQAAAAAVAVAPEEKPTTGSEEPPSESNQEMEKLKDKLHRMKTQYQSSLQRMKDIEAQVVEHDGKFTALQRRYDEATHELQSQGAAIDALRREKDELLADKDSVVQALRVEHAALVDGHVNDLREAQARVSQAHEEISALQSQVADQSAEIERLRASNADHEAALATLRSSLETTASDSAGETAAWEAKLASLRTSHNAQVQALQEEMAALQQAVDDARLAASHWDVERQRFAAEEDALRKKIVELTEAATDLEAKLGDHDATAVAASEAAATAVAAASTASTATIASLEQQLLEARADLDAARKETSEKDEKLKKAIVKLKQKMKDNDELAQQVELWKKEHVECQAKLVLSERQQQDLQVQLHVLRSEQETASKRVHESEGHKTDFEQRLKALNDALLASEERLSAILLEKNKLRDEQLLYERSLAENKHSQETMRQEKEQLLRRLKEMELKEHEAVVRNNDWQQQAETLKASNASLTSEVNHLRQVQATLVATEQQLKQQLEQSTKAAQQLQELQEAVEKERQDFAAKEDALNERVKKLKGLLAKVNQASQEKESKLNQLELRRPKRFLVLAKVTVNTAVGGSGEASGGGDEQWTLVLPDAPPSDDAASTSAAPATAAGAAGTKRAQQQPRWVEEATVQEWLHQGSSIIGAAPENLTEQWAHRLRTVQQSLERERDDWRAQFDDVSQQFSTYKIRAQTALKRIGTDDKERQRQKEQEQRELEELRQTLATAQATSDALALQVAELRAHLDAATQQLQATEATNGALTRDAAELQRQLTAAQEEHAALQDDQHRLQASLQAKDKELQRLQTAMDALHREIEETRAMTTQPVTAAVAEPVLVTVDAISAPSATAADNKAAGAARSPSPSLSHGHSHAHDASALPSLASLSTDAAGDAAANGSRGASYQTHRPPSLLVHAPPPTPSHSQIVTPASSSTHETSKFLIHQQADHLLRENLQLLRDENSSLNLELQDLRNDMSLQEEQIAMLKATVRELEASLLREQEFNASNRHVNAEYLVNVLRKFLLAVDASERYKLVGVLCQMLHLQPDETRLINERWAVRGGGLVGWLLPPKPAAAPVGPLGASGGGGGGGGAATGTPMKKGGSVEAPPLDPYAGMGINLNPY